MNYLAHLFLSGDDEDILIGNYITDGLKKKDKLDLKPRVLEGTQLHYFIDDFTDSHPVFLRSKKRIFDQYGHYSSVIMDLFYDHFLAQNWSDFSKLPLQEYATQTYEILDKRSDDLPRRSMNFLAYMKKHEALTTYASIEGMSMVLGHFSNRAKNNSGIEKSSKELVSLHSELNADFKEFFPEIFQEVRRLSFMKNVTWL